MTRIVSQTTDANGRIVVETEHEETLSLIVRGENAGIYAVIWDAGEHWMAGQFVDVEDEAELIPCHGGDGEDFDCNDGRCLVSVAGQDGGYDWSEWSD